MMIVLGYFAMALVGLTLGLVGAGGSILTVPIMVYLFGYSSTDATGFSLGVVGVTAIVAFISYWRQGKVDAGVALRFVPGSIIGVLIARKALLPAIPDRIEIMDPFYLTKDKVIMLAFAVVMVFAARSMIVPRKSSAAGQGKRSGGLDVAAALATGVVTGFVGAGGGFLIIPALVTLMGIEMSVAVGTSLLIIAINSLSGFIAVAVSRPDTPWMALCVMGVIASTSAIVSARWVGRVPQARLKVGFGWFVLVMGGAIILGQLI